MTDRPTYFLIIAHQDGRMSKYNGTSALTPLGSRKFLRRLELEAYASVVSAFRAQGHFSKEKRSSLEHLSKCLGISPERHRAEVRRSVNDDTLGHVADCVCGVDTEKAWRREGQKLLSSLPPRLVSHPHPPLLPQALTAITANTHTLSTSHASNNTSNSGTGSEHNRRIPTPIQNALRVILSNGPSARSDQTPSTTTTASKPKVTSSRSPVKKTEGSVGVSMKEELGVEPVKSTSADQGKIYSQLESLLCEEQLNTTRPNTGSEETGYRVNSSTQTSSKDINQKEPCHSPLHSQRAVSSQDRDVAQTGAEDAGSEKVDVLQEEAMETETKEGGDGGKAVGEGIKEAGKTISDLISRLSRKRQRSPKATDLPPAKKKSVQGASSEVGATTGKARVTVSPLVARAATATTTTKATATSAASSSKPSSQVSLKVTPTSRALSILKAVANSSTSNKALTTAAAKLVSRSNSQGKSQTSSSSGVQVIPISSHTDPAINQAIETLNKALSSLNKAGISSFSAVAPSVKASAAAALISRSLSPSRRTQPATPPNTVPASTATPTSQPTSTSTSQSTAITTSIPTSTTTSHSSSTPTSTTTLHSTTCATSVSHSTSYSISISRSTSYSASISHSPLSVSTATSALPVLSTVTTATSSLVSCKVSPTTSNIAPISTASIGVAATSTSSTASDTSLSDTPVTVDPIAVGQYKSQDKQLHSELQRPRDSEELPSQGLEQLPPQELQGVMETESPSLSKDEVSISSRSETSAQVPHRPQEQSTLEELSPIEGPSHSMHQTEPHQQVGSEDQSVSAVDLKQQTVVSEAFQNKLQATSGSTAATNTGASSDLSTSVAPAPVVPALLKDASLQQNVETSHPKPDHRKPTSPRLNAPSSPELNLVAEQTSAVNSQAEKQLEQEHLTATVATRGGGGGTLPEHHLVSAVNMPLGQSVLSSANDSSLLNQTTTHSSHPLHLPTTSVPVQTWVPTTFVPVCSDLPVTSVPVHSTLPASSVYSGAPVRSGVPVTLVPGVSVTPIAGGPGTSSMPGVSVTPIAGGPGTSSMPVVTVTPHPFVEQATMKPHLSVKASTVRPHPLAELATVRPHPLADSATLRLHPLAELTLRPHPLAESATLRPCPPLELAPAVQSSIGPRPSPRLEQPVLPSSIGPRPPSPRLEQPVLPYVQSSIGPRPPSPRLEQPVLPSSIGPHPPSPRLEQPVLPSVQSTMSHQNPGLEKHESSVSMGTSDSKPVVMEGARSLSVGVEVPSSSLNISELIEDTSDSAVSSLASQLADLENAIPLLNMDLMSFLQPATPESPVPTGGLPMFPPTPELSINSAPTPPTTPLHPAAQALLSPVASPVIPLPPVVKESPEVPSPLVLCGNSLPSSQSSQPLVEISTLATSKDIPESSMISDRGSSTAVASPSEYLDLDINSLIDPSKLLEGIPEDMAKSIQTIVQLDEETWK